MNNSWNDVNGIRKCWRSTYNDIHSIFHIVFDCSFMLLLLLFIDFLFSLLLWIALHAANCENIAISTRQSGQVLIVCHSWDGASFVICWIINNSMNNFDLKWLCLKYLDCIVDVSVCGDEYEQVYKFCVYSLRFMGYLVFDLMPERFFYGWIKVMRSIVWTSSNALQEKSLQHNLSELLWKRFTIMVIIGWLWQKYVSLTEFYAYAANTRNVFDAENWEKKNYGKNVTGAVRCFIAFESKQVRMRKKCAEEERIWRKNIFFSRFFFFWKTFVWIFFF